MVEPENWVGGVTGYCHGRDNSVNNVDGDSELRPICCLLALGGETLSNRTITYLGEICPFNPCLDARQFSSFPSIHSFQAAVIALELIVSESK